MMNPGSSCVGACLIETLDQARKLALTDIPNRKEPHAILMSDPAYFEVKDEKNPFMEGKIGAVDQAKAVKQWEDLKATFEKYGFPVKVCPSAPGLEDMVFTANQVLAGETKDGKPFVVLAKMVHESRQKEVPHFSKWFSAQNYRVFDFTDKEFAGVTFEGQGDAIWHPGKHLLYGGYGHRTAKKVYSVLSEQLAVPVVPFNLVHKSFYHLDTAFCPLDQETVLYFPGAFDKEGQAIIKHYFAKPIAVSEEDAHNFACNAVALERNVVLQKGSADAVKKLKEAGFNPVEVETGEFMKSGGSACCMKMFIY